jgi:hypothetical protein
MFLSELDARVIEDDKWKLIAPFKYALPPHLYRSTEVEEIPCGSGDSLGVVKVCQVVTVPEGFITDLASIPKFFRMFISGAKETRKPAVIHDYLYQAKIESRAWADAVFREAIKEIQFSERVLDAAGNDNPSLFVKVKNGCILCCD